MVQEVCGDSGPNRHFISTKAGQRIPIGMTGQVVARSGEGNKVLRWMFLAWCRCRFSRPLRRIIPSREFSEAAALHRRPSLFCLTCSIQASTPYLSFHLPARLSLVGPSGTSPGFKPSPFL
ncbi:hypothetical protein BO79DRAFT_227059 [Aspergillus costaricaensis CBS 115574]|uniref:Uncharacterized protein n=1 Tax=Aspergillus costaricaensis CBS 115574 TaxID=1448317 RepID=A0ACD1IHK7_9EURO|nr:hypothetical protein BO79DRAFT_227059 [Aspergillus costaricaensis CBS 115574]RAK90111.1 hypothetical protein BO79DRAFT_227059 [Aspergillus costaricaensis CBS 115574]